MFQKATTPRESHSRPFREPNLRQLRHVDYKDIETLKKFLNPYGRILARKRTGVTVKMQKKAAEAIKRARFLGLLPYVTR